MRRPVVVGYLMVGMVACRPSDVLSVSAPTGVVSSSSLQNQNGAEGALHGGKAQLFTAVLGYNVANSVYGLLVWSELLTDEFTFSGLTSGLASAANIDARRTAAGSGFNEYGDPPWGELLQARASLVSAVPELVAYEPASGRSKVGEAYALAGYTELLLAESYCAGTILDGLRSDGTIQRGMPLSTDSLFGVAEAHLDSATGAANGDAAIGGLAAVGLGRVLLDRGRYVAARAAVVSVPTGFVYNGELEPNTTVSASLSPNIYAWGTTTNYARFFNVANGEGGNGLNFVTARDPRLAFDTSQTTYDGTSPWYLPSKFATNLAVVPLATGLEARLIEAEGALKSGDATTWLADLNTLRNSGCTVNGTDTACSLGTGQVTGQTAGLPSLGDPGTDSGRVSLMFRERAFWLFGTGTRLGDLRRLVRQYGRDQSMVFPTGPYANGGNSHLPSPIPDYGLDVNLTLPTAAGMTLNGETITNPNYRGCIASTKTA